MTATLAAAPGSVALEDLSFRVDGATLLRGISLDIRPGELVGVIGPNGAGKSTLLRTVAGLLRPTGGRALVDGREHQGRHADLARCLAFVSQGPPQTHGFTALEIVLTGRNPHLGRFQFEGQRDHDIALACMERTGTRQFAGRLAATLSGGELQRVFLARALAQEPRVLVLDEPTANLDVLHQLAVFRMLSGLSASGLTVLVAVHDLQLAARFCSRLVLLAGGALLADGPPAAVLTAPNIAAAFGVDAIVFAAPGTGELAVYFRGPLAAPEDAHDI